MLHHICYFLELVFYGMFFIIFFSLTRCPLSVSLAPVDSYSVADSYSCLGLLLQVVKVADFGVARVKAQTGVMTAETGTYRWMAPEVRLSEVP